ncbi:MAG: subclass B3 metallo-beta-lactamase [Gammaproteobacteria bacterium]|nr:subclass B3 metallo-beta-lactamase [Gammaproteobacteria bacterium]
MRTVSLALLLAASQGAWAQTDWNAPFPPHTVMDNLHYIGTEALASFLVTTPAGHILINSDFESTVPSLKRNVEALGFRFEDIRIVLGSHAHGDHMEADAMVKEMTGASVMHMAEDMRNLESMQPGGKAHPVDRVLHDGDTVKLGGMTLTAIRTPGHTEGCTSWAMDLRENGQTYHALVVCSYGVNPNYILVDNPRYPGIADDYRYTFAKARTIPVDVFLGSHGSFYGLPEKYQALVARQPGDPNPFVDPQGYLAHVDLQEGRFKAMLAEQSSGAKQ